MRSPPTGKRAGERKQPFEENDFLEEASAFLAASRLKSSKTKE